MATCSKTYRRTERSRIRASRRANVQQQQQQAAVIQPLSEGRALVEQLEPEPAALNAEEAQLAQLDTQQELIPEIQAPLAEAKANPEASFRELLVSNGTGAEDSVEVPSGLHASKLQAVFDSMFQSGGPSSSGQVQGDAHSSRNGRRWRSHSVRRVAALVRATKCHEMVVLEVVWSKFDLELCTPHRIYNSCQQNKLYYWMQELLHSNNAALY